VFVYDRTVPRLLGLFLLCHHALLSTCPSRSLGSSKLGLSFSLDLGLIPLPSVDPIFRLFRRFSNLFFRACCTPCPVDPLQRLFFLFKDQCHLVGCPSLRCHRCRGLSFIHRRWWPRDQSPVSGCPLTEPGSRPESSGWRVEGGRESPSPSTVGRGHIRAIIIPVDSGATVTVMPPKPEVVDVVRCCLMSRVVPCAVYRQAGYVGCVSTLTEL